MKKTAAKRQKMCQSFGQNYNEKYTDVWSLQATKTHDGLLFFWIIFEALKGAMSVLGISKEGGTVLIKISLNI